MKKIIVIDDDPIINFICKKFIRLLAPEFEVIGFTNPLEAFDYLKKYKNIKSFPILLDLNMPEMSGWEFLEKCDKDNLHHDFFILSSSIDPNDKHLADKNKLVKKFISKPLESHHIEQIINRA